MQLNSGYKKHPLSHINKALALPLAVASNVNNWVTCLKQFLFIVLKPLLMVSYDG